MTRRWRLPVRDRASRVLFEPAPFKATVTLNGAGSNNTLDRASRVLFEPAPFKVTVALNGAGSNNTLDARSLTGNLQRLVMLVVRDSNGARQDYLTDPIVFKIDDRTIANYTQADLFGLINDMYGTEIQTRPTGTYLFPRFFNPGTLVGQGWLPTSGATKEIWTTSTLGGAANVPGTVDILIEDLVPLQGLPATLTNI